MTGPVDLKPGDRYGMRLVSGLTRTQIVQFAGASGDYNPIHTDEVYATRAAGLPGVMAHGRLVMGMAGRAVTERFGNDAVLKFGVRFLGSVWPGDSLDAIVEVVAVFDAPVVSAELSIQITNQKSERVLSGSCVVALQGR